MAYLEGLPRESLLSLKRQHIMAYVCKVASEQTIRHLEQCPLDRCGDLWQQCTVPRLKKPITAHHHQYFMLIVEHCGVGVRN